MHGADWFVQLSRWPCAWGREERLELATGARDVYAGSSWSLDGQAIFVWERLQCQCFRFALYLIVLSLNMQIQQGMGKTAEE